VFVFVYFHLFSVGMTLLHLELFLLSVFVILSLLSICFQCFILNSILLFILFTKFSFLLMLLIFVTTLSSAVQCSEHTLKWTYCWQYGLIL
jgi:hypothetical protein